MHHLMTSVNSSYFRCKRSSSSKNKRKSTKRSRTSIRNRKGATSYKEETSSSDPTSSSQSESDESIDTKKSAKKRRKKKARHNQSNSDISEISPQPRDKKPQPNNLYNDEGDNSQSDDFDPYSNPNSSTGNPSRLSSRGRLLKTVPQY